MAKLIPLLLASLLITSQHQRCEAEGLSGATIVQTLGKFILSISGKLFEEPKTIDETQHVLLEMKENNEKNLHEILNILNDFPSIIHLSLKEYDLQKSIDNLFTVFEEAVSYKKLIKIGVIESATIYDKFSDKGPHIDTYMSDIRYIILNQNTMHDLLQNFTTDVQIYESVCKTGISHLQLLDRLLRMLKISTTQYFITRTLMYDFLDIHNSEPIYSIRKEELSKKVHRDYKKAVNQFRSVMANASREIWTCDLKQYTENPRYENSIDSPYFELLAFQKYILSEQNFRTSISSPTCDNTKCHDIKRLDRCRSYNKNFCNKMRLCTKELVGCKRLHTGYNYGIGSPSTTVCMNKHSNDIARFTSVFPNDKEHRNFSCETDNNEVTLSDSLASYPGQFISTSPCHYCDCICPENDYYISLDPVFSSYMDNKVVTGAKLSMLGNILYIHIQEGKLLEDGSIDNSNIWKKKYGSRKMVKISWDEIRSIDLTQTVLTNDRVVTGFKFEINEQSNTISLALYSAKFDFRTGNLTDNLYDQQKLHLPGAGDQELDLSDLDVPSRAKGKNIPDSKGNQYLKFTISSLEKDGGQSTIPFIDTQELKPKILSPLSGAGLVHRGHKGYGGFLALKLYTYDINPHIETDEKLDITI